jgi:hypothetical protein
MCLSKINLAYDKPSDLIVDAWKEFGGTSAKPESYNVTLAIDGKRTVPLDQWIKASDKLAPWGITASDGKTYKPGFHAYSVEKKRLFRRVYLRKITCVGSQDNEECYVAQEMYVPSDPDGWPPKEIPAKNFMQRVGRKP